MPTRPLEQPQRKDYFDRVSRSLANTQVDIDVSGMQLGDQVEADALTLRGLVYDPKSDLLEVVTEQLDHLVTHPREIYVEDAADGLHSVEVIDADGNKQVIRLKSPLLLTGHA